MFKKVQCVLLNDLFISPSCRRRPQVRALYMTWKYTRSDTQVTGKLLEDKGAASLRKQSSWVGVDLRGRRFTVVCGNNPQPPLRCVSGLQTENSGFNWNRGVLKCQRETLWGRIWSEQRWPSACPLIDSWEKNDIVCLSNPEYQVCSTLPLSTFP